MLQRKKRPLLLFLSFAILLIYLGFSDYQFIGEAQKLIGEKGGRINIDIFIFDQPNVISAVDSSVVFPSVLPRTYFLYFRRSLLHKYEQHIIFFDQRSTIWNEKEKDSKLLRQTGWQFFHKNNKSQPFTLQSRCRGLHVPHPQSWKQHLDSTLRANWYIHLSSSNLLTNQFY